MNDIIDIYFINNLENDHFRISLYNNDIENIEQIIQDY